MYYRLTDDLNAVGKLIPENTNVYDLIKKDKDHYLSVYKYTEMQKQEAEQIVEAEKIDEKGKVFKYKRPKGIKGIEDVVTNMIGFDLDSKTDLDKAKKDTITVVARLLEQDININDILVSFSGSKGFSVVVHHNKDLNPQEHRVIAEAIAGDLSTWDTTLYNAARIFRIDGTKHNVTGLYKTPLDPDDLYDTVDQIKERAKTKKPRGPIIPITLPDAILKLKPKLKVVEKKVEPKIDTQFLDFSKKPSYLTDAKYALQKGYIPEGHGNEGMMILCSTYKSAGFDMNDAFSLLKSVNEKRSEIYGIAERSPDSIWKEVVQYVYSSNWKGGTYSPKENDLLKLTAETFGIQSTSKVEGIESVTKDFLRFAENINMNIVKTGIKSLDESVLMTTGMLVGVLGAPSAGKTSLVTSIIENTAKTGQVPLFHSLDMHKHLMSMRLIQRVSGMSAEKKLRQSIKGDPTYDPNYSISADNDILNALEEVQKVYKNVEFNFTRGATIESIEEDIKIHKAKHGDRFKLVVVDYLEKVRGPYSDATANSGFVASRLSDLASTYDVAIIVLLQPQKSAGDPSEELLSMRKVKGASVIEQDCRVILTMWRPGFSPKDSGSDKFATVAIVKNNMGEVKTLDYSWSGLKGELKELSKVERDQLKSLRDAILEAKEAEKSNGSGWDL